MTSDPDSDAGIDTDHLLAEHRAACAELRQQRTRIAELEVHNAELVLKLDELRMRLIRLGDWRPL